MNKASIKLRLSPDDEDYLTIPQEGHRREFGICAKFVKEIFGCDFEHLPEYIEVTVGNEPFMPCHPHPVYVNTHADWTWDITEDADGVMYDAMERLIRQVVPLDKGLTPVYFNIVASAAPEVMQQATVIGETYGHDYHVAGTYDWLICAEFVRDTLGTCPERVRVVVADRPFTNCVPQPVYVFDKHWSTVPTGDCAGYMYTAMWNLIRPLKHFAGFQPIYYKIEAVG